MPVGEGGLNAHMLEKARGLGPKREGHGTVLEAMGVCIGGNSDRLVGSERGVESWVGGVAKVEAMARDKTTVPQWDMFNVPLVIPSPLA